MSPMVRGHTHKYQLLGVTTTTISERTVNFRATLMDFTFLTAITGQQDLCVMGSSSFFDLLFDDVKGIHWKPPVSV